MEGSRSYVDGTGLKTQSVNLKTELGKGADLMNRLWDATEVIRWYLVLIPGPSTASDIAVSCPSRDTTMPVAAEISHDVTVYYFCRTHSPYATTTSLSALLCGLTAQIM
jgi:hypothetical protein